jgi:hypothetical protein
MSDTPQDSGVSLVNGQGELLAELLSGNTYRLTPMKGENYQLLQAIESQTQLADNLIVLRSGNDLIIRFADGLEVVMLDYFEICLQPVEDSEDPEAEAQLDCSITVASDGAEGMTIGSGPVSQYELVSDASPRIVYAHGDDTALASTIDSRQVDYAGTANADTYTGTSAHEVISGGAGNDTLAGNGGNDLLLGGDGDDVLQLNQSNIDSLQDPVTDGILAAVDGGAGVDTLMLLGSSLHVDFTSIDNDRVTDIEKIDITGSGDNALSLTANDVLDMSSTTDRLYIDANSGDTVNATGFTHSGTSQVVGSVTYDIYTHSDSSAELWIDENATVVI